MKAMVCALLLVILPATGSAQPDLHPQAPDGLFCLGVITALLDTVSLMAPKYRFCRPATATYGQAVRVVISYIEAHPQDMHEDYTGLAMVALLEAWPCARPRR